ncbi:unnamed protein product [Trichobilharzia szidati]|nr:unnamed protein product [Trichobilharzia szidati]
MPLFKLVVERIQDNHKLQDVYRWAVKGDPEDVTYTELIRRIEGVIEKPGERVSPVNIDDYTVTWFDGEDMCRISCTDDLHDAIVSTAGLDGNAKSIRIYVASKQSDLKHPPVSKPKRATGEDIQLPDLPEELEHLDLSEANVGKVVENTNESQQNSESDTKQTNEAPTTPTHYQNNTNSAGSDYGHSTPTAPQLSPSPNDPNLPPSLKPEQPILPGYAPNVAFPRMYPGYSRYPPQAYANYQPGMMVAGLPGPMQGQPATPPLTQNMVMPHETISTPPNNYAYPMNSPAMNSPTMNRQLPPKVNRLPPSMMNLPRQPGVAGKTSVDTMAIISRLRLMGFQQNDVYLTNLIRQHNGNLNTILDRLSSEENRRLP